MTEAKHQNSASAPHILDILRKKRNGHELSREEIEHLVLGHTRGEIPDHQAAAWLMAAHVRGLSRAETAHLTDAMLRSGEMLDLISLGVKAVDKHSTGGVGDKTSLILAPLVAAGGLAVPMISGRGLGHTGGTLDKLEAIPGFVLISQSPNSPACSSSADAPSSGRPQRSRLPIASSTSFAISPAPS